MTPFYETSAWYRALLIQRCDQLYRGFCQSSIFQRKAQVEVKAMQLTTKGRYAVTAMLDLSMHGRDKPINLAEISERQGISVSYLEQLFSKLRRESLVNSVKGPGGGYRLSRDANDIFISEVIRAVDEKMDATSCGGAGNCFKGEQCMTHQLWEDLSTQLKDFLAAISLASLVNKQAEKNALKETQEIEIKALS